MGMEVTESRKTFKEVYRIPNKKDLNELMVEIL
jgi:hypothetical protein